MSRPKAGTFFMGITVSIQGFEGSFHHSAVTKFFNDQVTVICCTGFREVVKIASDRRRSDGGFMAIENSIAGSILPNYNLIQKERLFIAGEIYLQINQNLLVNPGVGLDDIQEVHSHPMALLQCENFLETFPHWKLVEAEDTALSAKRIHDNGSKNIAAIGSSLAAKIYGLEIIAEKIQSNKENYTRFLFVTPVQNRVDEESNKASINFHTNHSIGSLAKVLSVIADAGINLSKLQSVPIPEKQWKYSFHADLEFQAIDQFMRTIQHLRSKTESLSVLGIYKSGKTISE